MLLPLARAVAAGALGLVAWTVIASQVFVYGAGLESAFPHPFHQWWLYLPYARSNATVMFWLEAGAAGATGVLSIGMIAFVVRGRDLEGGANRIGRRGFAPTIRAATDNHGHAEWLTIREASRIFPGPSAPYGGVVVGEAYRVDLDRVSHVPFDPASKKSWGKGGSAKLLIDPCRSGPTHSLVFAGAGSFKSTCAVSTLLTWSGSVVVLDPSGELGPMLAGARRAMGHAVHQIGLQDGSGFNVLDWIDIEGPLATTHVLSVAEWVCGSSSSDKGGNDEFFASRGKALVACLLAHLLWDPNLAPEDKTLRELRRGLSHPEPELRGILAAIHQNSASHLARDFAGTLKDIVAETFSGIYANADEATSWLANPAFAAIVSGRSFRSLDLLKGKLSVFVQLPLSALQTTPAVGRTLIGALLNAAYEADGNVNGRILYLLDEVARLGPMKIIETARDAGRKYGITLQLLYQSVGQLEKQWGKEGKREWYDGVSHRTYAAIQDLETAKELSESFGEYTVRSRSTGRNYGSSGKTFETSTTSKGTSVSIQESGRALIRHDELMNDTRTDEAFVVVRGARPLRCGRAIYFRRPAMVDRIGENRFAAASTRAPGGRPKSDMAQHISRAGREAS